MTLGEEIRQGQELEELRQANYRLQRQLVAAKARTDNLVLATYEAARDAMIALGAIKPVPAPKADPRRKSAETALWHLTDWQGAKLTSTYNSQVMRDRLMLFCQKAAKITEIQRADHPVRHCVIAFGGDMVEGLFNFPTQPFEVDATIFEQYVRVSRLLVDVVRFALTLYDTVEVIAEWGNHGRIGSKRSAVPRSDNFDRMTYELSRQLLEKESRLIWKDCPDDVQRIVIGNYRCLLIHGDEIGRTGYAAPNTIVNHVNKWRSGGFRIDSVPWPFQDCLVGHYHNHSEHALADGLGAVYFTGSTESDNRYARDTMASSAVPSQRIHFIHPEKSLVTAQYRIILAN